MGKQQRDAKMNEYMNRMEVLAEEINNGERASNWAIAITLNPPTVDWSARENLVDCSGYDCVVPLDAVSDCDEWDGASLAEVLENIAREAVNESEDC